MGDKPKEPGVTLGRLMAAERNALAAVEVVRKIRDENSTLMKRVLDQDQKISQLQSQISDLNAKIYQQVGSGPTQK